MKKRISLLICAVMLFTTVFSVFPVNASEDSAAYSVVYVCETGNVPSGIPSTLVHTDLPAAINALTHGGIVYVCGDMMVPLSITSVSGDNMITVKGYSGTSARARFPVGRVHVIGNLTFDDIIVKGPAKDESWVSSSEGTLCFGADCTFERSDPYTHQNKQTTSGIYIGHDTENTANGHYIFNSPNIEYNMLSSLGHYGSAYIVEGNLSFDLNDGIFLSVNGGVRNGNSSSGAYQTLKGDATFNLNGGTYSKIYTNNTCGGHIKGNLVFNINGGTYSTSSKFIFGNSNEMLASNTVSSAKHSSVGNLAVIVNADKLKENGSTVSKLTISESTVFADIPCDNSMLILNHSENTAYLPKITVTNVDYLIKAQSGSVTPVFEETDAEGHGEFLGFDIISDNEGYLPYINGSVLTRNANGYYDLPGNTDGSFVQVYFENPLAGQYFSVSFGDVGEYETLVAEGNNRVTLPVGLAENNGYYFGGWQKVSDNSVYSAGESFLVCEETEFKEIWLAPEDISAIYVNGDIGNDESSGVCRYAPVKTLGAAVRQADALGVTKIVLMTKITDTVAISASTERLVITGKDDETNFGGALIVSTTSTTQRPVTFEYMGLGSIKNQFICTSSNNVIFGDGLRSIDGLGIEAHFGNQYRAASTVDVEIKSGIYNRTFFGGAYLGSDMPGVTGDARLTLSNVENFDVNIGFDAYSPYNGVGSIEGSAQIVIRSGSIAEIRTSKLSEIKGSLYVICYGSSVVPSYSTLPEANSGNYLIRVVSDGTVEAAVDENGAIKPGYINAFCGDADKAVRITMDNGYEEIREQGEMYLTPGSYTVEYIEKGTLDSLAFTVTAPVSGHPAEKLYFSTDKYFAVGEWSCNGEPVDRFQFNKTYTLTINLTPCQAIDASALTSAKINSYKANFTANEDGTYTISCTFGQLLTNRVKYVSASKGKDSNGGTISAPYATLSKAIQSLASNGGVIYICDSVNAAGTYPTNSKRIVITGDGYPEAELYLNQHAGAFAKGDITFENIRINMGMYSHFNDMGNDLIFADSVDMSDGNVHHVGTYSSTSVVNPRITVGKNTVFAGMNLGGAYHKAETSITGDAEITVRGTVKALIHGSDSFESDHIGSYLAGNVLVTLDDEGQIGKISTASRDLAVSDTTAYQFVFNNGSTSLGEIADNLIPVEKIYRVYSGIGGRVLHAKDENDRSITGAFDIIPDIDNYAVIKYNDHMTLTKGGRYQFPPNTDIIISYVDSKHPIKNYIVDLDGGAEKGKLFSIDADGNITFLDSPVKKNYIFEGWYYDADFTELAKTGDYVGEKIELYAKYLPFSLDTEDEQFVIRGVQMRLPDDSSNIQGLRFIITTDNDKIAAIAQFSDKNTDMLRPVTGSKTHYGCVVLPTEMVGGEELVLDGDYYKNGRSYTSRSAEGKNLFSSTDEKTEYTVCLLDISPEKYEYAYTVRPYLMYYTRSGNLSTFYGEAYSTDIMKTTFAALEGGTESFENESYLRETILPEYAEARDIELLPMELLKEIEAKTEQYKQNVLDSENMDLSSITGTIYYVSPTGNDQNDGTSPATAWKTLGKVSSAVLSSGDAVLFERGAEFRGKLTAKAAGVTYSAYGTGAKPIINGSTQNYADPDLWVETDIENVYKLTAVVKDVGFVALNHSKELGKYDELMGTMRVSGVSYDGKLFTNQYDLHSDLEAYSNLLTNTLYMYSSKGNPGERFSSIELGEDGDLLEISSRKNMTIDNIDFRYGGGHGIGGSGGFANYDSNGNFTGISGCANLTVTNCIFSWIGGSNLRDTTRYGNAVEIFGSVDGYHVENNWIYQIYDTGITHQVSSSSTGNTLMQDILYKDNLIEYCHWSIEFYNQNCDCCLTLETPNHSRIVRDVLSDGNIVRMGGYGWGSRIRKDGATLYNSFGLSRVASETENFHAKDNIFFRCTGGMYRIYNNASEDNLTFESNLWIQDYGATLAWYKGGTYRYLNDAESYFCGEESHLKEVNTQGVYFYAP